MAKNDHPWLARGEAPRCTSSDSVTESIIKKNSVCNIPATRNSTALLMEVASPERKQINVIETISTS